MKYTVIIEEIKDKKITIESDTEDNAMDKAKKMYFAGKVDFKDVPVNFKLMAISSPEKDISEFVEF